MARGTKSWATKLALGAGTFALVVSLPSTVSAFGALANEASAAARTGFAAFTPASVDPRLAEILKQRSAADSRMMRFTPAGAGSFGDTRSVTVAVRIDAQVAQAISGRGTSETANEPASGESGLRIAPTRYNLGLARGYQSFAQAPALSASLSSAEIPDLAEFRPSPGAQERPSRFAARIELERQEAAARAAEESALGNQMLDVGGSYRLTRNLDVTAGVRLEQDRDLRPLPDTDQQDSQAVYIGTQFRF